MHGVSKQIIRLLISDMHTDKALFTRIGRACVLVEVCGGLYINVEAKSCLLFEHKH